MASTYTSKYQLLKPDRQDSVSVVNAINNNMDLIDSALWDSLTQHGLLTASHDLNSLDNGRNGIWNIGNDIPLNAPNETGWPAVAWSFLIQIKHGSFIHQYIIRSVNMTVYMREYSGNPVAWGAWRLVSGKVSKTKINYGAGSYVEYWKNGNIGCLYAYYKATDGTLAAWSAKTIATLPAGFRPLQSTIAQGSLDREDGDGTFVGIDSNGSVQVCTRYNAFNNPDNIIRVNITYPIFN